MPIGILTKNGSACFMSRGRSKAQDIAATWNDRRKGRRLHKVAPLPVYHNGACHAALAGREKFVEVFADISHALRERTSSRQARRKDAESPASIPDRNLAGLICDRTLSRQTTQHRPEGKIAREGVFGLRRPPPPR